MGALNLVAPGLALCPQLAGADISWKEADSPFDPEAAVSPDHGSGHGAKQGSLTTLACHRLLLPEPTARCRRGSARTICRRYRGCRPAPFEPRFRAKGPRAGATALLAVACLSA